MHEIKLIIRASFLSLDCTIYLLPATARKSCRAATRLLQRSGVEGVDLEEDDFFMPEDEDSDDADDADDPDGADKGEVVAPELLSSPSSAYELSTGNSLQVRCRECHVEMNKHAHDQ